jgi:hypothetical protein
MACQHTPREWWLGVSCLMRAPGSSRETEERCHCFGRGRESVWGNVAVLRPTQDRSAECNAVTRAPEAATAFANVDAVAPVEQRRGSPTIA